MNDATVRPLRSELETTERPARAEVLTVVVVLVVGLTIRVAYAWWYVQRSPGFVDSQAFLERGAEIRSDWSWLVGDAEMGRYESTKQPPLFVALLSLLGGIRSSRLDIAIMLSVMSSVTVGILWWRIRVLLGRCAGLCVLVLSALYVHMFIQGGLVMSEVLAQFLVAVLIAVWPISFIGSRWPTLVFLGMVCGLLALTRAELLLVLPVLVIAVVGSVGFQPDNLRRLRERGVRLAAGSVLLVLVGFATVYSPWLWYTNSVLGSPVPSSGSGVYQMATSCEASLEGPKVGYRDVYCNISMFGELLARDKKVLRLDRKPGGLAWNELAQRIAAERIAEDEPNMLKVRALRVGRGFGVFRPFQTAEFESEERLQAPVWLSRVQVVQWFALLALAVPGVFLVRRSQAPLAPLLAVIAASAAGIALGFGASRYRAAADPAVLIFASVALAELIRGRHHVSAEGAKFVRRLRWSIKHEVRRVSG